MGRNNYKIYAHFVHSRKLYSSRTLRNAGAYRPRRGNLYCILVHALCSVAPDFGILDIYTIGNKPLHGLPDGLHGRNCPGHGSHIRFVTQLCKRLLHRIGGCGCEVLPLSERLLICILHKLLEIRRLHKRRWIQPSFSVYRIIVFQCLYSGILHSRRDFRLHFPGSFYNLFLDIVQEIAKLLQRFDLVFIQRGEDIAITTPEPNQNAFYNPIHNILVQFFRNTLRRFNGVE